MSGILGGFEKKIFNELKEKVSSISFEYNRIEGNEKHAFLNEQFDNLRIWADGIVKDNPAFSKIRDVIENLSKASDHFFVGNASEAAKYHKQAISKAEGLAAPEKKSFVSQLAKTRSNTSEIQR